MANQEQNPPQQEQPFVAAKQVSFNLEDIILDTNNEVPFLYLEHNNKDYFKCVSDFISKCCLRKPFIRSPNMYKEYLAEFWYSAIALENSKVSFSILTGGVYGEVGVNTYRNAIGAHYLSHSSEYVAPPSIDIVRQWFPTIRFGEEVSAKGTLRKSLLPLRWRNHKKQDTSSRSGNDAHADDADIRPIYDEEPMAEVQTTAEINVFAIGQQHTEQPEFNNEGEVDQNAEQCHDTCPLPATLTDNQTTELSNQSLESENIRLKKTVAQFQKDFSRMEAHCANLELKYQNQVLKEGQHGQFSKVKNNEAKVKHDIDVIETINIELEHKVAKLLKENETLKRHYKEMFDSIKTTRAKNIEHTTSLIAKNDDFKAQLQEKGFAIAALKNELRKLTGNSVNTKFAKSSILGNPALQPCRNQSVVRQPTAFKFERPRISKQRFASQVDVNNDLSKPVTTHYLPKERESAVAKPHHMIAPGSSRYSSNDMVHNHYLEEAKKKTQESCRNSEPSVMPSARSQSTTNGSKPKPRINNKKSRNWPKCVFNVNHDSYVTKFLNEVNSRAKVPSNKTTKRYIPVEQTSFAKKPERQIPKRHRSSIKKTSVVHEKTMTPRSCLRWKSTGKLFKTVGLKWIPTGKIFTSSTTKVDSDPTNGSDEDITNQYECEQTLDVSVAMTSDHNSSELGIHDHSNELSSSKLVPKVVPPADKTATSRQELELLFHHHITMLRSTWRRLPTKIELTLEQSQQGVSNDVLVSIEGVEELKRNVWIKGLKKVALHTT
ncbi:hypothetical protein Tco_0527386 [Tanacetum coccineum]